MVLSGSAGDDKLSESGYIVEIEQRSLPVGWMCAVCVREKNQRRLSELWPKALKG